jgi:hypothetical protein
VGVTTSTRLAAGTDLGRPVDLSSAWNASDADLARRFHPLYGQALGRLPAGDVVLRGLPFALGAPGTGEGGPRARWILVGDELTIDLGRTRAGRPGRGPGYLVIAHFSDSWRAPSGARPQGTPVGWVLPAGEALARYELLGGSPAGSTGNPPVQALEIRRRFEIADGIIGWGFLPFAAVSHHADAVVDWRGPFDRQTPGRYAPAGHAGPLTTLPGTWAAGQSGAVDYVPTADDDATLWLHALRLDPGNPPAALRVTSLGGGRPGTDVVIAGMTFFDGAADPLVALPRRQFLVTGAGSETPAVDLGLPVRWLALPKPAAEGGPEPVTGWGRPITDASSSSILDVAAAADARLAFGDWLVALDDLASSPASPISIRELPRPSVRVAVRVTSGGRPVPVRVRFVADDGRYLPPLGHRDEVNPGIFEDTGAGLILGADTFAYVGGEFAIDLPIGAVAAEVTKGFEHRPLRTTVEVGPGTTELAIELERVIDLDRDGWRTSDSHVHFLAPSTALLQAAAEDLAFVHLLATQLGDHYINVPDLAWGSTQDPSGRHAVIVGTENRQNVLGHLALLGANPPVQPLASGGAPEGRIGQAVSELLADWAIACRAAGGLVVGAHFPLPYAEIAADIVAGLIDAVELQCFAPGLDNPSILEWYRFLNCGYRLPLVGGTDKMSAEVPVGAVRTYARLDPEAPPSFEAWSAAIRAGRTFVTSGPVLDLRVDGAEPGTVVSLPAGGGRLAVTVRAQAAQPVIDAVELVVNGRVVARETAPASATSLSLAATLPVTSGSWISARSLSGHEIHSAFLTSMAAHTSPVYVEVLDRPLFIASDAEAILPVIDGTVRWLETIAAIEDPATRAHLAARIAASGSELRRRLAHRPAHRSAHRHSPPGGAPS